MSTHERRDRGLEKYLEVYGEDALAAPVIAASESGRKE